MNVLYLTTVYPGHKKTGGDIGTQRYVDALMRCGAHVDLVAFLRRGDPKPSRNWEHIAEERSIETAMSGAHVLGWMLRSFASGEAYSTAKYHSRAYVNTVRRLLKSKSYSLVVLDHPSRLLWLRPILPPDVPVVANTHNIEHRLYERLRDSSGGRLGWLKRLIYAREARLVKQAEDSLGSFANEIWAVSASDGEYYAQAPGGAGLRAFETPPGDFALPEPWPAKRFDIGLIGNWSWTANRESLDWFLDAVLPHLPAALTIEIAGRGADDVGARYPRVRVHGFVRDAAEFVAEARVIAIPTLSGAGVQIKTLDSLAVGTRMVATPFAVLGIRDLPPTVRISSDPREYAQLLADTADISDEAPDPRALQWADAMRMQYSDAIARALADLGVAAGAS